MKQSESKIYKRISQYLHRNRFINCGCEKKYREPETKEFGIEIHLIHSIEPSGTGKKLTTISTANKNINVGNNSTRSSLFSMVSVILLLPLVRSVSTLNLAQPSPSSTSLSQLHFSMPSHMKSNDFNHSARFLSSSPSQSSTAEYFYAQDKLSDDQVERIKHFSNQSMTSNSTFVSASIQFNPQSLSKVSTKIHLPSKNRPNPIHFISQSTKQSPFTNVHQNIWPSSSSSSSFSALDVIKSNNNKSAILANNSIQSIDALDPKETRPSSLDDNSNRNNNLNTMMMMMDERYHQDLSSQLIRPVYIKQEQQEEDQSLSSILLANRNKINQQSIDSNRSDVLVLFGSDTNFDNFNTTILNETFVEENFDTFRWDSYLFLKNITFELKDEQWVAPIIAMSILNMLVIVSFECFVIYRACRYLFYQLSKTILLRL
ncbi:major abundant protein BTP1 [Sarcoptes scabiei]|nr:major abundant protein BTP1 [Sarcoptes scabiei]